MLKGRLFCYYPLMPLYKDFDGDGKVEKIKRERLFIFGYPTFFIREEVQFDTGETKPLGIRISKV